MPGVGVGVCPYMCSVVLPLPLFTTSKSALMEESSCGQSQLTAVPLSADILRALKCQLIQDGSSWGCPGCGPPGHGGH